MNEPHSYTSTTTGGMNVGLRMISLNINLSKGGWDRVKQEKLWKKRMVGIQHVSSRLVEVVGAGFGLRDGERENAFRFDRDHVVLILQDAFDHKEASGTEENTISLEQIRVDDGIGDAGFVLEAKEYETFGGARTLASDDASADTEAPAAGNGGEAGSGMDAECFHFGTAVRHGMRTSGQTGAMEVGDEALFVSHALQRGRGVGFGEFFQQRAGAANSFFDLPEGVATVACVTSTE